MELALDMKEHIERARAQTVLAEFPGPSVLLGVLQGGNSKLCRGAGGCESGNVDFRVFTLHAFRPLLPERGSHLTWLVMGK